MTIELGALAWLHERRDRHGEWTDGPGGSQGMAPPSPDYPGGLDEKARAYANKHPDVQRLLNQSHAARARGDLQRAHQLWQQASDLAAQKIQEYKDQSAMKAFEPTAWEKAHPEEVRRREREAAEDDNYSSGPTANQADSYDSGGMDELANRHLTRHVLDLARAGSYRPPRMPSYKPTGGMRKATAASMRKLASDMAERHPDLGAHEHIKDAAQALDRNQPHHAARHLIAAIGNMQPQSLRRHGLLTDDQHDAAKRSMDAIHRHLLLVKDIEDTQTENQQLPHAEGDEPGVNAPGSNDLTDKPTARPGGGKAMNAPETTNVGRIDINVSKPQQMTSPKHASQIAASNSGDLTTSIELSSIGCYRCGRVNSPDAMHCKYCSNPIQPSQPYDHFATEDVICPNCGRGDDADAVFCDQCGKRIQGAAAAVLANLSRSVDLAYNPDQPRDRKGKWSKMLGALENGLQPGSAVENMFDQHTDESHPGSHPFLSRFGMSPEQRHARHNHEMEMTLAEMSKGTLRLPDHMAAHHPGVQQTEHAHLMDHLSGAAQPHSHTPPGTRLKQGYSGDPNKIPAGSQEEFDIAAAGFTNTDGTAVELAGPKGYEHGWRYVGGPGLPSSPPKRADNYFSGGKGQRLTAVQIASRLRNSAARQANPYPSNPPATPKLVANGGSGRPDTALLARIKAATGGSDEDWRAAIANYDVATRSGKIKFGSGPFADKYPGQAGSERAIGSFVRGKLSVMQTANDQDGIELGHGHYNPSEHRNKRGEWDTQALVDALTKGATSHSMKTIRQRERSSSKSREGKATIKSLTQVMSHPLPKDIMRSAKKYGYATGLSFATELSAQTGRLAVTPSPRGKPGGPGLYNVKGNEHSAYLQNIVKALIRSGHDSNSAYAIARASIRRWSRGGGHVHPEVRAAASGAEAQENAAQARAHAHANGSAGAIELGWRDAWRHEARGSNGEWISGALGSLADTLDNEHPGRGYGDEVRKAKAAAERGDKATADKHLENVYETMRHRSGSVGSMTPEGRRLAGSVFQVDRMQRQLSAADLPKPPTPPPGTGQFAPITPQMRAAWKAYRDIPRQDAKRNIGIAAAQAQVQMDYVAQVVRAIELTGTAAGAAKDSRVPAGQPMGGTFGQGQGSKQPTAHQKHVAHVAHVQGNAAKKAALLQTARNDRAKANQLIQQRNVLMKALASASGKVSKGQKGSKTASTATTKSNATTAPAKTAPASASAAGTAKKASSAKATTRKMSATQIRAQIAQLNTQITALQKAAAQAIAQAAKL